MAVSKIVNPSEATLKDLLGNGRKYFVPPYQRDYSWKEENWEDLWTDILEVERQRDGEHYMGTIVLQPDQLDSYIIIDGQQRITTLSLVALAAVALLEEMSNNNVSPSENAERAQLLRDAFLGTKDPGTLRKTSKIELNRNDNGFYQGTIVQMKTPLAVSRLSPSNELLWKGLLYFKQKLYERFPSQGEELANFLNIIVGARLRFLRVQVSDELSAYTVFETLNARGVELTASDLLKNYLMALVHRRDKNALGHVLDQWERIVTAVGAKILPEFLRHYLNSKQRPYVRQERLFKTIRTQVSTGDDVFNLLDELERAALWYQALSDPTDPLWSNIPNARESVRVLNLFGVKQYKPLILSASRATENQVIEDTLRFCVAVSFRHTIIGDKNTNELEKAFNDIAVDVHSRAISQTAQIRDRLSGIALSDEEFQDAFARKVLSSNGRGKRLSRYILCALERQLGNTDIHDDTTSSTIEHILPENMSSEWEAYFPNEVYERYVYRLGNYTLLDGTRNREAEQKPFPAKLSLYHASNYEISRRITGVEWNPNAIESRQQQMAKWAKGIWKL